MEDLGTLINNYMHNGDVESATHLVFKESKEINKVSNNFNHANESDFVGMAKSVPNWKKCIAEAHFPGGTPDNYTNPLFSELQNIYFSVLHNAGVYYDILDVLPISKAIASRFFREIPEIDWNNNFPDYYKFSHSFSGPIPIQHNGDWNEFKGDSPSSKVEVIELRRKRNADKSDFNKYRVRKTIYERRDSVPDGCYSPMKGWFTESWVTNPSYWTKQIRECISETVNFLCSNGAKVFSVSEGGAYKGTSTDMTDVDTTVYTTDEACRTKWKPLAEGKFQQLMEERNLHFKKSLDGYLLWTVLPENENTIRLVIKPNREEGFLLNDGLKTHFISQDSVMDLSAWRERESVQNIVGEQI